MLHTFCDICIKAIDKGMRPNTHFDKNGWKYVITTFKAMTGRSFTKQQLKNKWDGAKKDWRIWKKLIAETGVDWNSETGSISASNEWWKAKIQEIRGAKKFKHAGIEPSLCCKFDRMFSNITATGQCAWAPSTRVLFDDDANLEEENGDSKEDAIPNFVDDFSNIVSKVDVANSSGKRKHREHTTQQGGSKSKRGSGIGAQLCSRSDGLIVMEGRESQDKAFWTKNTLHAFCDICIKAIDEGMRPNTHFDKNGWRYVITTFKAMTGCSFTKQQLKNKWDGAKKDWRIWKKLIAETGVGWNSEIGTISASNEWWKAKIQEIKGAKKFKHAGIEPSLCSKFDRMFGNIVATGQCAWTPSTRILFDDGGGDDDVGNDNGGDDANLEEENGDSKSEDAVPNFEDDVSSIVAEVNVANSNGKRKHREHSTQQGGRKSKKGFGIGAQLCSRFGGLIGSVSTKSECTSTSSYKKGCSIEEVMAELHSIDGIIIGDDFHCYASDLFCSMSNRVMWSTMGDLDTKLKWLTNMYERSLRSLK